MKTELDSKMAELKTLLQRAPQVQEAPSYVGTPWEESTSEEGQTRFVWIIPKSVILPSSNPV